MEQKHFEISYRWRKGEDKQDYKEVIAADSPEDAVRQFITPHFEDGDAPADAETALPPFAIDEAGHVRFAVDFGHKIWDEETFWGQDEESLYGPLYVTVEPISEAAVLADRVSRRPDILTNLLGALLTRHAENQIALDTFNGLFETSGEPEYDTELAESDGKVQGQQEAIEFVLGFLREQNPVLDGEGLGHLKQVIAEGEDGEGEDD